MDLINDITPGKHGARKFQKVVEFIAGATVTALGCVSFDVAQADAERVNTVVDSTATNAHGFVGIALEAATAGKPVRVVVEGYVEGATTDGTVAQHNALFPDANGDLHPFTAGTDSRPIGYALEADTGTACDVWIFNSCYGG